MVAARALLVGVTAHFQTYLRIPLRHNIEAAGEAGGLRC